MHRSHIQSGPDQPGNLATAFLNRAVISMRAGCQYEKAFADYKRALELDPSNALIPYNVGNAYLDSGQPVLAAEAFSRAVSLDARVRTCLFQPWHCAQAPRRTAAVPMRDFRRTLEL